ncbi:MAG: ribosome biogenesis GTPase Der [Akkermansia sp.]|nr:ribosome biogenesis GTPase Der [Akkermansia sp.]
MQHVPTIAIVGRPNVGKSAIFNRMAGRRIAIVHDEPGVTRDRLSAPCNITDYACKIMDTGGIGATLSDGFAEQVTAEADLAIKTADMIMLVMDCRDSLTPIDQNIADQLRKSEVPVMLVLNKADHEKQDLNIGEFASLGFDNYIFLSAAHGRGFSELSRRLDAYLKSVNAPLKADLEETQDDEEESTPPIKVAIVGRPNAGKSSLCNAILHDKRTIVSAVAGTTRDAIDIPYLHNDQPYTLIDTAGMRPRSRRDTSVEVFSAMRSEKAIRRADICLLVIDIAAGITQQDRRIAGMIAEEGKPCIIVVNKFDLFHPNAPKKARMEEVEEQVRTELFFIAYAPFVATSAKNEEGIEPIFKTIQKIRRESLKLPTTGQLNRLIQLAQQMNPPGTAGGSTKRLKIYYVTTAVDEKYKTIPVPRYVLFVNDKNLLTDSYSQYLRNKIREQYPAPGIPVIFSARSRVRND